MRLFLLALSSVLAAGQEWSSVGGVVDITDTNFGDASHMAVAWLLHLDEGNGAPSIRDMVSRCAKHYNVLHSERAVRVGRVDLPAQPQAQ